MVLDVVLHEAGDEVVAVVVAGLHAAFEGDARGRAGLLQAFRLELFFEKGIGVPLVYEDG